MGEWYLNKAGIYSFGWLNVGSNTITQAVNPLTITAMSPEPPVYQAGSAGVYNGNEKLEYVFAPDNDAAFRAVIGYSNSATKITAYFTKDGGTTLYESVGTIGTAIGENANYWNFQVPVDSGSQDGTWKLVKLACEGVYDKANNLYDENNPMELAVTDSPEVKVVCVVNVSFNKDQATQQFGGTSRENATAHFMDSHTGSYELTIADKEGEPLQNVQNVQLSIEHLAGSSKTHGGYTFTENIEGTTAMEKITLNMTAAADGIHYSANQTFQLAGVYTVQTLSFNVSGRDYKYTGETMPSNSPKVEVYSMQPTVRITNVNPVGGSSFGITSKGDSALLGHDGTTQENVINWLSDDGYSTVLHLGYSGSAVWHSFTVPKVTLSLSNVGSNFNSVVFRLPKGKGSDVSNNDLDFTFTPGSLSQTQSVGQGEGGPVPQHSECGNQTIEQVTATYGGISYTVTLSHNVRINQVSTSPELSFKVPENMTLPSNVALPGTLYVNSSGITLSQNGNNSFTYQLPTLKTFTVNNVREVESEGTPATTTKTENVAEKYTQNYVLVRYRYYTRTVTTTETATVYNVYNVTYTLSGWKINNRTYKVGETVTVTGTVTAEPIFTATKTLQGQETKTHVVEKTLDTHVSDGNRNYKGRRLVSTVYTTETVTSEYDK